MIEQYGKYSPIHEYLSKLKGHWMALPSSTGTLNLNCVGRISLLKELAGIDVLAMYPTHETDPSCRGSLDLRRFLKRRRGLRQSWPFIRAWARADRRLDQQHGHPLFRIRSGTGQRQG